MINSSFSLKLRLLLGALLLVSGAALAAPVATIEEIVVNKNLNSESVNEVNIRVNTLNTGSAALDNPTIHLWIRENEQAQWRLLKTWEEEISIAAGERLSRDFFAVGTGEFDAALFSPTFLVKAEVRADGDVEASKELVYVDEEE